MIKTTCQCGTTYQLEEKLVGKKVKCKQCQGVFEVRPDGDKAALEQTGTFSQPPQENTPTSQKNTPRANIDRTIDYSRNNNEQSKPTRNAPSYDHDYGFHRILKDHAAGGQGRIFIARDEQLKRDVALKEVLPKYVTYDEIKRRFTDEAEITARLEHPGIVPIHALGVNGKGQPFYTMKFVHGKTFKEAIRDYHKTPANAPERNFALRELLRRFASVCQTLAFAHDHGIIHRDLKPANIMLGKHGETLVMDWGLAKPYADTNQSTQGDIAAERLGNRPDMTGEGGVLGTLAYMPPEQAKGELNRMEQRSDVFSLGAILYEILVGAPPITGETKEEVLEKAQNATAIPPSQLRGDVPKGLEAIVLKAMAKEPRDRYQSANTLFQDVTNWLDDEPLHAKKDTLGEKTWRWVRKHKSQATILFLILCLVSVLGVSGYIIERAFASVRAANLLALEKQRQLEEARRQLAEKEKELESKEKELQNLYTQFFQVPQEQRDELQKRIDALTTEVETLQREIATLKALIASLSGETVVNDFRDVDARNAEIERTAEFMKFVQRIDNKVQELHALATLQREKSNELIEYNKDIDENDIDKKKVADFDDELIKILFEHSRIRWELADLRNRAYEYAKDSRLLPQTEVERICDRVQADTINSEIDANIVFVADYAQTYAVAWGRPFIGTPETQEIMRPVFGKTTCKNWIVAHATSNITLEVPEGANRFTSFGGMNQNKVNAHDYSGNTYKWNNMPEGTWTYQVWQDGVLTYESAAVSFYQDNCICMDVPIKPGTKKIELITGVFGNGNNDWSIWGNPSFHIAEQNEDNFAENPLYHEVRRKYPDLQLPDTSKGYEVVELDMQNDPETQIRATLTTAKSKLKHTMIVARTTPQVNLIKLVNGEIAIDNPASERSGRIVLASLGEVPLTLDADEKSRIFNITNQSNVAFAGVTLSGGKVVGQENGGGIFNSGKLLLCDSHVINNHTNQNGGGIYNTGKLSVFLSSIISNTALGTWSQNGGGGIWNSGELSVSQSAFIENSGQNGDAGGIYIHYGGRAMIANSLLLGNTAVFGGGICNNGKLFVCNSTITGNKSSRSAGGQSGMGIHVANKTWIYNSIITKNYLFHNSERIEKNLYSGTSADITVQKNLVEQNNVVDTDEKFMTSPQFDSEGRITNLKHVDLRLQADSPAIDAGRAVSLQLEDLAEFRGVLSLESIIESDAAGQQRVFGKTIDIGAFEYQGPNAPKGTLFTIPEVPGRQPTKEPDLSKTEDHEEQEEPEEPHLIPLRVDRSSFPEAFLGRLRDVESEIAKNGGYAVAGRVGINNTPMPKSTDFTVGIVGKDDFPTYTFDGGFFISRVHEPQEKQPNSKVESPRIRALGAKTTLFDKPFRYEDGKVNFYRIDLTLAPKKQLGTVSGRILTENGRPAVGADVNMSCSEVPGVGGCYGIGNYLTLETKTDSKGTYSFQNVMPHGYSISGHLTGYDSDYAHLNKNEFRVQDITLSFHRAMLIDVVFQPDGSTDFSKGNVLKNRYEANSYSSKKIGEKDNKIGRSIRFDPTSTYYGHDLMFTMRNRILIMKHFYNGGHVGHYDVGKASLESITHAEPERLQRSQTPCQEGHVYVVRTYDTGHYAKFIVREIRMLSPEEVINRQKENR